jgi:hypothetical protein
MVNSYLDSLAAWYQASFGNPVAGGAFAHFQSAAMGGYGLGVLNTALRGVVGVATGCRWLWGRGMGLWRDDMDCSALRVWFRTMFMY